MSQELQQMIRLYIDARRRGLPSAEHYLESAYQMALTEQDAA